MEKIKSLLILCVKPFALICVLALSVGNAWAIDWTNYAVDKEGLVSGEEYYLYANNSNGTYTTNHFVKAPDSYPTAGAGRANYVTDNHVNATKFTFVKQSDGWVISYGDGKYLNNNWGGYKSGGLSNWNTTLSYWTIGDATISSTAVKNTLKTTDGSSAKYYFIQRSGSGASAYFMMTKTSSGNKDLCRWQFISEEAYNDATASNQYYYTVAAQAYTNGAASTDGGTVGVVPKTYQKPDVADWAAGNYTSSIAKRQKGSNTSSATVTFYAKIGVSSESYNFAGFTDGDGNALTASADIAANTYYEVDAVNHIYRVTIAVNGSEGSPTNFELHACFASAAEPVVNVYNTNDEVTGYGTLAAALDASANGYRVELLANIENVSSTIAINKDITLDFNGYSITGSATNLLTVSGNVTFVDNSLSTPGGVRTTGATAVLVSGGSLTINDGKYKAALYAVERTGGSVTIKSGGFESDATQDINGTITLNGGFFYHNSGLNVTSDYAVSSDIPTGMKYTTADYRYMVVKKTSENYPVCVVISKNTNNQVVSRKNFNTLAKAIAYANNNADDYLDKTLLLREDYTLPAGNYTIPKYTTLVVPYAASQTDAMPMVRLVTTNDVPNRAYCTLTLASGVHIDVFGAVEVGGVMTTSSIDATGASGVSRMGGETYGLMQMNSGSSITIYDDANLYAWGFIQGEGTIDMRRGAVAREMFQIYDWKGFSPTADMAMDGSINYTLHVLPINQYFIQNVEVKTTYRPGSKLFGQVGAYVFNMSIGFNDIGIVGVKYSDAEKAKDPDLEDDVAIFLMDNEDTSEDTWVCKYYNVATDQQVFDVNNSAHLGSLVMKIDLIANGINIPNPLNSGEPIVDLDVDSRDFVLPLTNNFKIHLLYGNLYVTQNTTLLPGSVIEVDKKATLTIMDQVWNRKSKSWYTSPQTLYLYDKDQWGTYVFDHKDDNYVMGYASRIRYRHGDVPTVRDISSPAGLGDAQLIVHGTVDVKGYLKTTKGDKTARPVLSQGKVSGVTETEHASTDGGASIISTIEDAGTITLSRDAGYESYGSYTGYVWQVDAISSGGTPSYFGNHAIPAWLTNEVGYTETATKKKGKSFCYIDFDGDGKGEWKSLTTDGCFVYDGEYYYAKPKDYVKLLHGKTEEENHTYQSADGSRTLILVDDCQWWEVEPVAGHPDLFHCTHSQNNVYYYYDYEKSKWTEKRYTVTWNQWDGTPFGDPYILKYGVQPKYLGDIPSRAADAYYTYDFIGWSPAITESTIVTGDVTYTAQYERKDVMYSVTWKDQAGNIIETGYYKMGDVPTCTEEVNMTGKEWTPAVGAVTGNTIYQLQAKNNDGPFDIKFMNWNGTQIGETQSVAKNAYPEAPANPSKTALTDVEFVFAGWRAADNQVYASNAIPAATANAVYTATFTGHPITYAIKWKNYDGTPLFEQDVTPNTVPQYTGATPEHAEEGYGFIGWTPAVVAATANATYTAVFELQNKTVDGETYTIPASTQQSLTTITIADDGKLVIPASSTLTVDNLILEATSNASGQLDISKNNSIATVNAYFDWKPNGETGTASRTWYAIAVPWEVDAENGIFLKETGRHLVLGGDFDLIYYSGSERASVGNKPSCWKYVQHDANKTMHPGQLYMMYFDPGFKTIRFAKKSGSAVLYTTPVNVSLFPESTDNMDKDANWNGIANPKTYYASLSAGSATYAQVLNNGSLDDYFGNSANPVYKTINLASSHFTVGKPLFVQATGNDPVVVTKETTAGIVNAAPTRRTNAANLPKGIEAVYRLAIAGEDQPEADNLFVQVAEEEKADRYTIGQDLVKGGVASGRAQAWVNRYNTKLSVNTQSLSNDEAVYPLTLQFPSAGDYTLSVDPAENDDYALYLTYDGQAIWNLTNSAYTGSFEKGTDSSYGLRVSAKAPQVATGIDEAIVDAQGETRKVIINDQVFIIRGDQVYSIDGQLVK